MGFTELVAHAGATVSPGELIIKAKMTSISEIARTGRGYATAAIKRFPFFLSEVVEVW